MRSLLWFTHDLRLDDNPALRLAVDDECLLPVFCVDPRWFAPRRYGLASMGAHRWRFLHESLEALRADLATLDQCLLILYEAPEQTLPRLVHEHDIDRLLCSRQFGWDERASLESVRQQCPSLRVEVVDSYTLLDQTQLPFPITEIPDTYSRFRRQAERLEIPHPLPAPESLPPPPSIAQHAPPEWVPRIEAGRSDFVGGGKAAQHQTTHYFSGALPQTYKEVRNALAGWDNSSKLSPWLNRGCLSPRRAVQMIRDYEHSHGGNESTYWLLVELLWREYFQWLALRLGRRLYAFQGTAPRRPLTCYSPERYQQWCTGSTPYALVNSCLHELAETGYLSNRGRQIVASCLVNEMNLDWRYGAAWFEHQLIDYDVASNWGNWQYIAGVGADSRGGRHFNLQKQTELFDPDGSYIARWSGDRDLQPLDSPDAAEWPKSP